MEDEEKRIAEERRLKARENSRVSEVVGSSNQMGAKAEAQDDNELFVAQEPAPKRIRRTPVLTNREIRQSIYVGLYKTGMLTSAALNSTNKARLVAYKPPPSRSREKAKANANELEIASFYGSDIIRDGQLNAQSEPIPTFTQGDKSKALKELLASIPKESQGEAKPDKQAVLDAIQKFSKKPKSDKKGGWKHPYLKTSLYNHQILGAAFMRERENSESRPKGGMLCDVMGLGKTIQTLANIVDGELIELEDDAKTTLIVVPRSVMDHWKGQIAKHVMPDRLKILYYYPGHRPDSSDIISTILSHNVVITSYEEIRRSYPKYPASANEDETQPLTEQQYKESAGPLHQIRFRRIVIDEGHLIRNPESQSSISIRALHAHFKWVLTGTPLLNHTGEFWAYFNFLDVPHIGHYASFTSNYCKGDDAALQRLVNVVRAVAFRRTHASRLFTYPIIVLPDLGERTLPIQPLATEQAIYAMIREMYIFRINSMAPLGDQEQQFRCFLVMLLKLRMCNSHPLIVQDLLKILLDDDENVARLISLVPEDADSADPDRIIVALLQGLKAAGESPEAGQRSPIGYLNSEFRKFLHDLKNTDNEEEFHARLKCICCDNAPSNLEITTCMHLICKECLVVQREHAGDSPMMCTACNIEICNEESLELNPSMLAYQLGREYPRNSSTTFGTSNQRPGKRGGRGRLSVRNPGSSMDDMDHKKVDWVKIAGKEMPSSKVKATRDTIRSWFEEDSTNKIVIFTQFVDMVFIFWEMCRQEDWGCVKLTGDMSFPSRQSSISEFGTNAETKVMIASLKAGGIGIDLTMANKCILVEPWWNDAVQQQAFCRLFRIGQERNVEIVKLFIEDTIDVYMMKLQEEKNQNIDEAISEKAINGRNTAFELMGLFGEVVHHEGGGILIRPRSE